MATVTLRRLAGCLGLGLALLHGCNKAPPAVEMKLPPDLAALQAEIEKGKGQLDATVAAFDSLVAGGGGDLKKSYGQFVEKLAGLESQAAAVRGRADDMRAKGAAYFKAWEEQFAKFTTPAIVEAAQKRREELTKNYESLTAAMGKARESYQPLVSTLNDLKKVMENDLNAEGVKSLAPKAKEIGESAKTVKASLDAVVGELKNIVAIYSPMK